MPFLKADKIQGIKKYSKERIENSKEGQKRWIAKRDHYLSAFYLKRPFHKTDWVVIVEAIELFKKEECFKCSEKVIWENDYVDDRNGRIFNIDRDSLALERTNWITLCLKCYKKMIIYRDYEEEYYNQLYPDDDIQ